MDPTGFFSFGPKCFLLIENLRSVFFLQKRKVEEISSHDPLFCELGANSNILALPKSERFRKKGDIHGSVEDGMMAKLYLDMPVCPYLALK